MSDIKITSCCPHFSLKLRLSPYWLKAPYQLHYSSTSAACPPPPLDLSFYSWWQKKFPFIRATFLTLSSNNSEQQWTAAGERHIFGDLLAGICWAELENNNTKHHCWKAVISEDYIAKPWGIYTLLDHTENRTDEEKGRTFGPSVCQTFL